jgi:hypothetical protein
MIDLESMPFLAKLALVGAFCGFAIYMGIAWIKELRFYRRNGWDFSKESGVKIKMSGAQGLMGVKLSAKNRVLLSLPLLIVGATSITIMLAYSLILG